MVSAMTTVRRVAGGAAYKRLVNASPADETSMKPLLVCANLGGLGVRHQRAAPAAGNLTQRSAWRSAYYKSILSAAATPRRKCSGIK